MSDRLKVLKDKCNALHLKYTEEITKYGMHRLCIKQEHIAFLIADEFEKFKHNKVHMKYVLPDTCYIMYKSDYAKEQQLITQITKLHNLYWLEVAQNGHHPELAKEAVGRYAVKNGMMQAYHYIYG
jgi:hypothetical protein